MADKPRTYPQQIQDLKIELEQKDQLINSLRQELSLVPELKQELTFLREQEELHKDSAASAVRTDKAKLTDLEQRAINAEQSLRNLQVTNQGLSHENLALTQQLDILGHELDKYKGKDQKIYLLSEELKKSNYTVAALNQRIRDLELDLATQVTSLQKQVRFHSESARKALNELEDLQAIIKSMPDTISALKQRFK